MNKLNIAIAGLGNVGSSVIKYIEINRNILESKLNIKIVIRTRI